MTPPRRALVVGVQHPLDPSLPRRPGTCAALRRVEASLKLGGWVVRSLLDDAAEDGQRPLFSNLLEGLQWVRGSGEALVVLSTPWVDGRLVPRDGRGPRTTLSLDELVAELPAGACLWIDGAVPSGGRFVAGRGEGFLRGLAGALVPGSTPLSSAAFLTALQGRTEVAVGGNLPDPLLFSAPALACDACHTPVPDARAAFCPSCGASLAVIELLDNGRFQLLEKLGAGGMGQVFLALDTRLQVRRAIKLLAAPADLPAAERADLQARLVQEARAAQTLSGLTPHVVRVFDVGVAPERGEPYLVMELLDGETLAARLARGRLPLADALAIGRGVAGALAVAHERGFIHRDIKPDNIMLCRDPGGAKPMVKLLDFGLVKAHQAEVKTESGRMMGTLQYMPPEQLKGQGVDARADVFSLGAVLYECFSGRRANPGRTQAEIFGVLLDRGVAPLVGAGLPPALCALIDACLRLDRTQRPAHAGAVAAVLARIELPAGEGSELALTLASADVVAVPTDDQPAPPRRRVWPAAVAVLGVLLVWALWPKTGVIPEGSPPDAGAPPSGAPPSVAAPSQAPEVAPSAAPESSAHTAVPLALPAELPARPQVQRALEGVGGQPGSWIRYEGAPADLAAAVARDLALGAGVPVLPDPAVEARWAELPPEVRHGLAQGVWARVALVREDHVVRVEVAHFSPAAPSRRISNGFGTFWTQDGGLPLVESGRCRLMPGDRLFSARWLMPGYTGGQCGGADCPSKLERALQKARQVGERLEATFTVVRGADEAARLDLPCTLGP
jgi:serine/threonine protein kinase